MPQESQSAVMKYNELMLGEVRSGLQKLGNKVDSYRDESVTLHSKLDLHIATCDLRYAAAQKHMTDMTPVGTPALAPAETALISRKRVFRKLFDKAIDYAVFAVIILVIFAFQHGAKLPLPSP